MPEVVAATHRETGEMTRADALAELERPLYTDNELAEDKAFMAKKLGISLEELEGFITARPRLGVSSPITSSS